MPKRKIEKPTIVLITAERQEDAWVRGIAESRQIYGPLVQRGPTYQAAKAWFESWCATPPRAALTGDGTIRFEDAVRAARYAMSSQIQNDHYHHKLATATGG